MGNGLDTIAKVATRTITIGTVSSVALLGAYKFGLIKNSTATKIGLGAAGIVVVGGACGFGVLVYLAPKVFKN